jgi:tripartite-type tricarboxylate transporter receptor subunit TctC
MGKKLLKPFLLRVILLALVFSLVISHPKSQAADYPTRPITLIVQFVAGTSTDIILRKLADVVSKDLGQPIVAVNKAGGGGSVGVAEIARSQPDGYTIGGINMPTLAIIPHMQSLPYDPLKDFSHICSVGPYEYGLYVKGDAPWKTFEDFIEYVRKNPGKVTYGSVGAGTTNHLIMVRLAKELNLDWKHVPFKGDGELIPAILGGHVVCGVGSPSALVPQIKGGNLKLLVVTSKDRWPYLPQIPTLLEKGFKFYQGSYLSLGAPAGTPEPIRQKLETAFRKGLQDPGLKKEFEEKLYAKISYLSGADYKKYIVDSNAYYKDFLKTIGLTGK